MKKWIVMLAMLSLLTACAQTPEPESAELTELSAATSESAEPEETPAPISAAEPTATPIATPEPTATPAPTPTATPAPTPAPTPEPTAAPTAEPAPAQVSMSYGAVPFDLAAGTEQWWSIDSSDSAYWAVQENINAMRAAGGLTPLTMDGGLSAAADSRPRRHRPNGKHEKELAARLLSDRSIRPRTRGTAAIPRLHEAERGMPR